jgi:hypothetical protein
MLPKTFKIFDFPIIRRLSVPDEGFSGKLDIYVFIDWLWFGLVPLSTIFQLYCSGQLEKTNDLSQLPDKLYHCLVVKDTICIGHDDLILYVKDKI